MPRMNWKAIVVGSEQPTLLTYPDCVFFTLFSFYCLQSLTKVSTSQTKLKAAEEKNEKLTEENAVLTRKCEQTSESLTAKSREYAKLQAVYETLRRRYACPKCNNELYLTLFY